MFVIHYSSIDLTDIAYLWNIISYGVLNSYGV